MLSLNSPIADVPFVGDKYKSLLRKMDIVNVVDLLEHYPSHYNDYSTYRKVNQLIYGQTATVKAEIDRIIVLPTRSNKLLTKAVIADETGKIESVWFNQPYLKNVLKVGQIFNFSGSLDNFANRPTLINPEYELIRPAPFRPIHTGRLIPIYPETAGVSSKWLRARIAYLLTHFQPSEIPDHLPDELIKETGFLGYYSALNNIHFPINMENSSNARKRLGFDEIFFIQLNARLIKEKWQKQKSLSGLRIEPFRTKLNRFESSLPFELTAAQKRCFREITADLERITPMNRLLLGDVGSGKTIVAALAIFLNYLNGYRSLYMAPTEILADQHLQTLTDHLKPLGLRIELLTGNIKLKRKNKKDTGADLIIGTHALLYDKSIYKNVNLVIIDEQHRFGVEQRATLLELQDSNNQPSDRQPHLLSMTATPIPRSLALTNYSSLDLSYLDELPKGRKTVKTWAVPLEKRAAAYAWIERQIKETGGQAFIVCPLIDQSEHESLKDIKSVKAEFEFLQNSVFTNLKLGLLHGRLKATEKSLVINELINRKIDILVSTPVIEVGIDIPKANIIVIEGAERFGLASLHQLRGRVGRSPSQSYCLLFASNKNKESIYRLKALEKYHEGSLLAELDLKYRGPGDFFGSAQHGFRKLKLTSFQDKNLIAEANHWVSYLLSQSGDLDHFPLIKERLNCRSISVKPN